MNRENIENTIGRVSLAQQMIAEMVIAGNNNIQPCNDCPNATTKGCVKVSYISPAGEKETGPLFEQDGVSCPSQKGKLIVSQAEDRPKAENIVYQYPRSIPLSKHSGVWGRSRK